jgi:hypothetical protein
VQIWEPLPAPDYGFVSRGVLDQSAVGQVNQAGDRFGEVLAAVRLQGVPENSLIVGMPHKLDAVANAGMVQTLHFANNAWSGSVMHSPYAAPLNSQPSSEYGRAIAVGDFNHDGHRDLAVGAPAYPIVGLTPSGEFVAWEGDSAGITLANLSRYQSAQFIRSN